MSKRRSAPNLADSRTLKRLLAAMSRGQDGTCRLRVGDTELEFTPVATAIPALARTSEPAPGPITFHEPGLEPIKTVAGTPFPDDDSPLNDADLVMFPPDIDASEVESN